MDLKDMRAAQSQSASNVYTRGLQRWIDETEAAEDRDFARAALRRRILKALAVEELSSAQIADILGERLDVVAEQIADLVRRSRVLRVFGKFRLNKHPPKPRTRGVNIKRDRTEAREQVIAARRQIALDLIDEQGMCWASDAAEAVGCCIPSARALLITLVAEGVLERGNIESIPGAPRTYFWRVGNRPEGSE